MNLIKYTSIFFLSLLFIQCSKKGTEKMVAAEPKIEDFRNMAPKAGPARNIEIGEYNSFDLENGLKVIVVENHKLPIVSYQISLLNPPIKEGEKAGYVSLAGDLISSGTTTKAKSEIDETVDFYGATINSSRTGLFMSSLKKHSDKLLELYTDILFNPSFPEDEFEKAKTQVLSGLASQKTDPSSISSNVAAVVNFGTDHPYGEIQTEKSTKNITLEDCKSFYDTYFVPNNVYLIIVGDVTKDEAMEKANKYFSNWKAGEVNIEDFDTPQAPSERKVSFAHKDGAVQSVIRVTYPVDLHPTSPDVLKATAMNQILGGGVFSGRLMQNLREDKAYTYGARSMLSSDQMVGTFNAGASVRNEVTDSSVHEILFELERMITEPVALEDLQLIKNSMAGSFARSLESPQTIARFARNIYKYELPKDYYATYLSRLDKITPEDMTAMAKKYIKPDNAHIVVVGNKDEVAEKLLPYDADGIIDYYGPYGEPVDYNAVSIPEGVTATTVIKDYLAAIGGEEKLKNVKSLVTNSSMNLMGQQASIVVKVTSSGKLINKMTMGGQVMQEQKFDGVKAQQTQMGQTQVFEKGAPEFDQVKSEANMFEQLQYFSDEYQIELVGAEKFNEQNAYKIVVSKGDNKETQFYDMKTSLLLATVNSNGEGDNQQVVTTNFDEYKEVNGIQMPYKITITGAAPFPLEMTIDSYQVDADIPDSEFEVK